MPSSYTTSLRLVLPVTGELTGTWGDTVNNGLTELVEAAIARTAAITMTDADKALTTANEAADEARCMFISLSGGSLTATRDVICPSVSKLYVVLNATTGGQAIRFKTAAGTGVTIPNGHRALLYCDGTNVTAAIGLPPLSSTGSNGSALSSLGALAAGTQAKTANYTVVEGDRGDVIFCTNSFTLSLTAAATLGNGFSFGVVNAGSGSIVIDPSGAETIDGAATKTLTAGQALFLVTDGATWRTVGSSTTQDQLPINQVRVNVASAATVNLTTSAAGTDNINITGTTTITAFTVNAGRLIFVRFADALTLTNNASIVTQAGANIITRTGDTCILRATAANTVEVLAYSRAYDGVAPIRVYQGSLSGVAVREFTAIPSWARKIVVQYWAVSTNGNNAVPGVEIGPSGYGGTGASITSSTLNANVTNVTTLAAPSPLLYTSWDQNVVAYGRAEFEFVGSTGSAERWLATLVGLRADVSATVTSTAHISFGSGVVVDRVRMNSRSADQWDAGEWSVSIYP